MIEKIQDDLKRNVDASCVVDIQTHGLQLALYINRTFLKEVCFYLRDSKDYYFDFLADIAAVDLYPEKMFEVVYHLTSIPFQKQLTLKVKLENSRLLNDLPIIPSVSKVWRTAEWHEREAFDLMGVFFEDHPDMRRILMPDDWPGYPLRKDYIDPESFHGIPIK